MRAILFLFMLLLATTPALATDNDHWGVGGGGWLYSGTFVPGSTNQVMIGSDMTGIHHSSDLGASWATRNDGLITDSYAPTSYVQGLLSHTYSGTTHNFAMTLGGIYRSVGSGPWICETTYANGYRYVHMNEEHSMPFPYSCVDAEGAVVVAGAGVNRFHRTNNVGNSDLQMELEGVCGNFNGYTLYDAYPSLCASEYEDDATRRSPQFPVQATVWIRRLDGTGNTWVPFDLDSGLTGQNRYGAARDIDIATVTGLGTYVVVSTHDGIFLHDMQSGSDWQEMTDLPAVYTGVPAGTALEDLGSEGMRPWSVALSSDGTLYAAMERVGMNGATPVPSGVWKIDDISATNPAWEFTGNDDALPGVTQHAEMATTVEEIGLRDRSSVTFQPVFMELVEVGIGGQDVLFLGNRMGSDYATGGADQRAYGMLRAVQDDQDPDVYEWAPLVFSENHVNYTYNPATQTRSDMDTGWLTLWGVHVIFEQFLSSRTVMDLSDLRIGAQFNGQMHVSSDGGNTWANAYCSTPETTPIGAQYWESNGYNEICVRRMTFDSDDRLIYTNGDVGAFIQGDFYTQAFDHMDVPVGYRPDWADVETHTNEMNSTLAIPDWQGSGQEAYVIASESGSDASSKLFMLHNGTWTHITSTLTPSQVGLDYLAEWLTGTGQFMKIFDVVCPDGSTIYALFSAKGSSGYTRGMLRGTYTTGWTWEVLNTGLTASQTNGGDLLYNAPGNRLFVAFRGAGGNNYNSDIPGGIYVFRLNSNDTFIQVYGGGTGEDEFDWVNCLAQSSNGMVVYAGTQGRYDYWAVVAGTQSYKTGTVLKCSNPTVYPTSIGFLPLANDSGLPRPFPISQPNYMYQGADPDLHLANVTSITVDPSNGKKFYVGIALSGLHPQNGIYSYNFSGCYLWKKVAMSNGMHGTPVTALALDPQNSSNLIAGTGGVGIYTVDLTTHVGSTCGGGGGGVKDPPIFDLVIKGGTGGVAPTFEFENTQQAQASIVLYDLRGRVVRKFELGETAGGRQAVTWDSRDESGRAVAAGVYFARLKIGKDEAVQKFVLMK